MRKWLGVVAALGFAATTQAAPVLYTFSGTFDDATTTTGTFAYDSAVPTVAAVPPYSFTVADGTLSAFTYTDANGYWDIGPGSGASSQSSIYIFVGGDPRVLRFTPLAPLDGSAASVGLDTVNVSSYECNGCSPVRFLTAGTFTLAVPNLATVSVQSVLPNPVASGDAATFSAT